MTHTTRRRDPGRERKERAGFVVLQHLHTLRPERPTVAVERVARDLVLEPKELEELLATLARAGLVDWKRPGSPVGITAEGMGYVERDAWRRKTVRVFNGPWSRGRRSAQLVRELVGARPPMG